MRKSFTRLLSLVMLFALFSSVSKVTAGDATTLWPSGATAFTKKTDKILIIYPGAVQAGTGSIRVSENGTPATVVGVIPATDPKVSYAKGDTVEVDLSAYLKELTSYTIAVDPSTFKTVATTPVNKSAESWSFTTGDYSAPVLKSVTPAKGASLTSSPATLVVTFEDASPGLVGTGNVALYKADGNLWDLINVTTRGAVVVTGTGPYTYTLTLSGIRALEDNTSYAVTVGSGTVTDNGQRADAKKNSFAGLTDRTVWAFSTKDFTAPVISSGYPKKGDVGTTTASVLVKANEAGKAYGLILATGAPAPNVAAVKAGTSVTMTAGSTEYAIAFTGLTVGATYDMYVVTENADGVASAVSSAITITTAETTAPTLSSVTYFKGTTSKATATVAANVVTTATGTASAAGLAVDKTIDNIILTFSEKIKIGAGNVIVYKSDNSVFATIPSTSLSIPDASTTSVQVKIPVSGLANNAFYYITMPNTLVLDVFNNKYSGMTATNAWVFTTTDAVAPTFTYSPIEAASGVAKDANIVLTFNELIWAKAPYAANFSDAFIVKVNNIVLSNPADYAVTSSTNDGKFTTITINPTVDFASEAVVSVQIKADALGDVGFNSVDTQGQGINFVVKDYVAPAVAVGSPTLPAVSSDVFKIKFTEGIYLAGGGEITNSNLYTILTVKKTDGSGENVPYSAAIDATKKEITITPTTPWASQTTYYVAVSSAIQDAAANPCSGASFQYPFTIGDVTSATVTMANVDGLNISTSVVPQVVFKNGSTLDTPASLYHDGAWSAYALADMVKVIVLKEGSATGADVSFSVNSPAAGTFNIVAALQGNKTYYLGVGASTKDASGNVNVAKFVTFTTKFEGVPTVIALSPADDATQVATSSKFTITYDVDVVKTGGTIAAGTLQYSLNGGAYTDITNAQVSISGKVVTIDITPLSNISNSTYDIKVAANVFENTNNQTVTGGNAAMTVAGTWNFITNDTNVAVTTIAPDFTSTAAIDAKLVLTFAEKVQKGLGYIDIKKTTGDALVERIDIVSSNVVVSDDQLTVTITPTANFSYNTAYYVEVSVGAIKDAVGNSLSAIYGKTDAATTSSWTFTTANPALTIAKVTPANGSDKVSSTSSIVVEFNREIAAVTPPVGTTYSVGYYEGATGGTPQAYTIGSSNVVISGKTLTITHSDKAFPANTAIYLYIPANVIKAANDAGILNSVVDQTTNAVTFNTGDVNAPVPTFVPAAFNSLSPVYTVANSNITITFDEDIYNMGGTLVDNTTASTSGVGALFTIEKAGPTFVNFAATVSGKTVTLDPTVDLDEFTDYTIKVKANKIKDSKGTVILADIPSTFRTEDKTAPVFATFALTGGIKQFTVPALTITEINPSKFYYLVREKSSAAAPTAAEIKAANNKTIAIASAGFTVSSLTPSTTYQFYYIADDTFGNTSDVAVLEASTTDTVAPTLVSTVPAANAVDVDVVANAVTLKLTFNENVAIGTGAITVRYYANNAVAAAYTQAALAVVPTDSKSLVATLSGLTLTEPTKYYVEISEGTIVDAATVPNAFAGAFGMNSIYFTTEDNSIPTVVAANSTTTANVTLDGNIVVAFSEEVKAGSGLLTLYKGATQAVADAVQVFTAAEATFSGKTATVKPTAALLNTQAYTLSVGVGFAKDLSTNANSNALSDLTTPATLVSFTTGANVKPSITSITPSGGATPIAKASMASIAIVFSEDIYLPIAGYNKPLALLTQAELLANVSIKDANGNSIAITQVSKVGTNGITLVSAATSYSDLSTYTLTVKGFQDNTGLVMSDYTATYKTSDGTAPTITFAPEYKATGVASASGLSLTFSENFYADVVDANKSIFTYVDATNVQNFVFLQEGSYGGTDVPFTATISGKVINIVPTEALKSGVKYYYGMKLSVEDVNTTVIPLGTEGTTHVYFTTLDYTAPKPVATLNATNYGPLGTSISKTASMFVKFDEDVTVSTGSVIIRREDGTIFQTVSGAGLSIDSTDKTKLKVAHNDFEAYQAYFVELTSSAVVDAAGNGNAAYSDPKPATGWVFTTADTYALTAAVTPNGANTPRSVNLVMTFNKVPTGQLNKYISIYKADGTAVQQTLASGLVANGKTITIPASLEADQSYYARVEAGAFIDPSSNEYAGISDNSWAFSTVNNIAPQVVTLAPADNALAVDASTSAFTMTFDRNVAVGTGVISVRYAADGKVFEDVDVTKAVIDAKTLTFNVTKPLDSNTAFYVYIPAGAITNTEVTKDSFAGILNTYDWNFTTATDKTAPKLVTWTPNATTTTDNDPTYVLTFDENVVLGAGNLKIYKKSDNALALTIPVTATMVNGKVVTVKNTYNATTNNGLDKNTDYYVLVDAGLVKDAAGNASAAVSDVAAWTFKTGAEFVTEVPVIDDSQAFKVYPNPFVDDVTVETSFDLTKVVVTNIAGQVVKQVVNPAGTIQLNELRSGVYFMALYQGDKVAATVKIVKR